ncbi:uncharacterized protein [Argopecten irradians]|uniref:uncharacterized protein n=1 Tax=Argopecten irradians TaxID=31199 RepID=UPI0037105821
MPLLRSRGSVVTRSRRRMRTHSDTRQQITLFCSWLKCCFLIMPNLDDITFCERQINYFNRKANQYNTLTNRYVPIHEDDMCIEFYFDANCKMLEGQIDLCEKSVQEGLRVARLSRKPDLFRLLLAIPQARVLYARGQIEDLRDFLVECFQRIDSLGRMMQGSVVGWLLYMRARSQNDKDDAINDYIHAIDAFNKCETVDKEFGIGHTLCRLNIAILGCGEEVDRVDQVEIPFPSQLTKAKNNFKHLQGICNLEQCVVIKILYLMAKSDYYYRTRNPAAALRGAIEAHNLAVDSGCQEFVEITKKRKEVYTAKCTGNMHLRNQHNMVVNNTGNAHISEITNAENVQIGDVNNKITNAENVQIGDVNNKITNAENVQIGDGSSQITHAENVHIGDGSSQITHAENVHIGDGSSQITHAENVHIGDGSSQITHAENVHIGDGSSQITHAENVQIGDGNNQITH